MEVLTPSEKTYPIAVALSGPWLACKVSETGTVLYNLDTHQRQTFEELFSNDSELFLNTEKVEGDWLYWIGSAKGNIYNLARNQMVNILPSPTGTLIFMRWPCMAQPLPGYPLNHRGM